MSDLLHHDWIEGHARQRPQHPAIVDLQTRRAHTYEELNLRVSRIAAYLRAEHSVSSGERVAVIAPNSLLQVELMLALGRLGAIFVPINWRLAPAEMARILEHCGAKLVFFHCEFANAASELCKLSSRRFEPLGDADPIGTAAESGSVLENTCQRTHQDIQTIMYTSGTTGFPKGVLLTFGMTQWNAVNLGIPVRITPDTVFLSVMPMFHTAGLNCYANCVLHAGGTVILAKGFDAETILDALSDRSLGITHFFGVPAAYLFMAQHEKFANADLSHLQFIGVGGAPLPAVVFDVWARKGVSVVNGFGMTETGPAVTMLAPEDARSRGTSIGKPLLHVETRIVTASGTDAASGEPGELWIRGPAVSPGYWQAPEATAEAFAEGWFKSGDVVSRDSDGFFYILDRIKDMYISGGENVYPAEVESVIYQIAEVAEAAVVGVADDRWGETGFAAIVVRQGSTLSEEAVRTHCKTMLARFKQPKFIHFMPSLPRTASGKVQKLELRRLWTETLVERD
jgi:fatty-acyl-CoA synthase